jgi:NADPH-dependent F420 reductase
VASETVCIVGGTGDLGYGLALRLGRAGVPIVIGSRDAGRARDAADRARRAVPEGSFDGDENPAAAAGAGTVIVAVPFAGQAAIVTSLSDALRPEQLVVDATVPLAAAVGGRPSRMIGVWQGSAAQQAQELVGEGVRVVSALHTVSAAQLEDLDHALDEDVLICGARKQDKRALAALLERVDGLRCVDCGRLETARITESLTALIVGLNVRYKAHAGIRVTGLPDELW